MKHLLHNSFLSLKKWRQTHFSNNPQQNLHSTFKQNSNFESSNLTNLLLHEFYVLSMFGIYPKIGRYRLPTHRCGNHKKFFPSYFKILIFCQMFLLDRVMQQIIKVIAEICNQKSTFEESCCVTFTYPKYYIYAGFRKL